MTKIIKQYRNLIAVIVVIILVAIIIAADPLGSIAKRQQERASIRNQIAIEEAETAKRIAIIKAEQEAELIRIHQELGFVATDDLALAYTGEDE